MLVYKMAYRTVFARETNEYRIRGYTAAALLTNAGQKDVHNELYWKLVIIG